MAIKLHNTLSNSLEEFKPIKRGHVGMYHCGPTVYDYAHIGNLRSYVFADTLRRTFEYLGSEVTQVVNITDIGHLTSDADTGDDKMVKGLKREGLPLTLNGLKKLADKYEGTFKEDLKALNIEMPQYFPRATEYLAAEMALVEALEQKGFAYSLPDGIYFDTSKLEDYGKLGGLTPIDESRSRVVGAEDQKRNPRDFVLWKLSYDDKMGFASKWGRGFPGWHIECSAMSRELLGQPFDIHTGGIEHIAIHHNNEIAQSEGAFGTTLANYWLHNEWLLNITGEKMAKSKGEILTLQNLIQKGFSPLAYRYFLLLSHYRTPTNFSWEALEAAENAYRKLKEIFAGLIRANGGIEGGYKKEFEETLENDLNTPEAIAIVWKLVKDSNVSDENKRATLLEFDKVLGLDLEHNEYEVKDIPEDVAKLMNERDKARVANDYSKADELREKIKKLGFIVEDTPSGQKISKS
ncbi:MAG: cysteine--tRNA ligase [Candidatus Zambryskibacteria bacterium CG11_big_fil_rev_8_21_14_0_20_42_18]|uniref:Cysteine--tRNA ligase n=1 Tax=Candidatus Zambryskibacteria bacterium CG_4_9_14_3_um_filter_42_15 TaxID=1975112 RepID=A0A2M7WRU0_9BACT|nr:MAG: cysteine--tRNA ligase [Candidatus Zambryskibacteria bacterium CG11_big_fil_rev_8_21_14_0_20_42_18]PJA32673.1 MAG: cysteine--tRNA ligase [Candidatus Zambryskibacteria bacterium CG_4_9_14_3_um_filter_42_15]